MGNMDPRYFPSESHPRCTSLTRLVPCTYIPFNGGPRICLGQNFALTEMAYAVARMCQRYSAVEERSGIKRGEGGDRTHIVLSPLGGVNVGLIPVQKT